MAGLNLFSKNKKERLEEGLSKTKDNFFKKFTRSVAGKTTVDDDVLDDLEEVLIGSDVGVDTTIKIIERIEGRVAKDKYLNTKELNKILVEEIESLLDENPATTFDADYETKNGARITSYNVCYTKLLRRPPLRRSDTRFRSARAGTAAASRVAGR